MACITLPAVSFSDCNPDVNQSEIEDIFIASADADDHPDWTDPAEWATLLSQTLTATGNEIRRLSVIGDKPAATAISVQAAKRKTIRIDATHVINFEIDDVSTENYAATLAMQAGVLMKVWYKTRGGFLFGGNTGIVATVDINPVLGRGDEIEKLVGTISWNSKTDPIRIASPI